MKMKPMLCDETEAQNPVLTKAVSRAIFTGLIKQLDDFHAL